MTAAGHRSAVAALRYQQATADRDHAIAKALSQLVRRADVVPITHAGVTPLCRICVRRTCGRRRSTA